MLTHPTYDRLLALGLTGMAKALEEQRRQRRPEQLIEHAVKGMIPHNRLGRAIFTKLKVYKGDQHPHEAQQPIAVH